MLYVCIYCLAPEQKHFNVICRSFKVGYRTAIAMAGGEGYPHRENQNCHLLDSNCINYIDLAIIIQIIPVSFLPSKNTSIYHFYNFYSVIYAL
jgi:hypothetical protein